MIKEEYSEFFEEEEEDQHEFDLVNEIKNEEGETKPKVENLEECQQKYRKERLKELFLETFKKKKLQYSFYDLQKGDIPSYYNSRSAVHFYSSITSGIKSHYHSTWS